MAKGGRSLYDMAWGAFKSMLFRTSALLMSFIGLLLSQTIGILAVVWVVLQVGVGAGSVWFGGALFGGGAKAKSIWKYHRYMLAVLSFGLFLTTDGTTACLAIFSSLCSYLPPILAGVGPTGGPSTAVLERDFSRLPSPQLCYWLRST